MRVANACNAPGDTSNFAVLYVNPVVSVGSISGHQQLSVFPNPAGDELFIKAAWDKAENLKYRVVDKTGKTLLTGNLNTNAETKVDVAKLAADIYLVEIQNEAGRSLATSRFTKL